MNIYQINMKCYHIEKMKEFYTTILELDVINESDMHFTVMVGTTKLIFERANSIPYYHFCLRTNAAFYDYMYKKLLEKQLLLPNEDGEYSMFWKGKQAYFVDPDGNILEMLERPFTHSTNNEPFHWFDIGEIGLPTCDVKQMQHQLSKYVTDEYKADSDTFAFFGDPNGVFVIVKEGRHWYPTERPATIHPLKIYVTSTNPFHYKDQILPYEIIGRKEWNVSFPAVQYRIARPTNRMDALITFYVDGLGLTKIGEFQNHEGYDGVMLGLPDYSYHIEFTQYKESIELPTPTKEHLLVFYIANRFKRDEIVQRLQTMGYNEVEPENPYWGRGGVTIEDPDGWRVVLMNTVGI